MTMKLRAPVPFPANVTGTGGISVFKENGIWTIEPDFSELVSLPSVPDPTTKQIWIFDPSTGVYNVLTLSLITDLTVPVQRIVTAAGVVTISTTDEIVIIAKTVPADTVANLPASAARTGRMLVVKVGALGGHSIALTENGTETIDGSTDPLVISSDFGFYRLLPITGGWLTV